MPQFGSMDEEKVTKKPLLPLSTMKKKKKKKKKPPSSFLSEAQVLSLQAALLFACIYAASAAYNLRDLQHGPPCQCPCQCQEPETRWLLRHYVLTGADAVDASRALSRRLLWCSVPQAAAAALALALLAGGRSRRGLGIRPAAIVALAAMAASHWMYLRILGLFRVDTPGDLFLAVETAFIVAAAALDLLTLMAFVLGVGGDEQAGRARARAGEPSPAHRGGRCDERITFTCRRDDAIARKGTSSRRPIEPHHLRCPSCSSSAKEL